MKQTILVLIICTLPALALAGGEDNHEHEAAPAADEQHGHDAQQHGHDAAPATDEQHGHDAKPHGHESSVGQAGDAANVGRTVEVAMDDTMRFTPDHLDVKAGETVRIALRNHGKIAHEFVIGSMAELVEHAEMMRAMPGMQHAESNMLTLEPGAQGDIVWAFDQPGTVDFACLIPGHLEAGMKGLVTVN